MDDLFVVEGGRASLRPQLARIADAVEVHDPSGILTLAEDTAGGVRLGVSGAAGCSTPQTGATLAVPLRDVAGRPLGPLGQAEGRLPLMVALVAEELTAWAARATPSRCIYWIGLADGPLSSAQNATFAVCENADAGAQRVGWERLTGGSWVTGARSPSAHADVRGAVCVLGGTIGELANTTPNSGFVYPYSAPGSNLIYRTGNPGALTLPEGATPHLLFGAGCDGTADVIEFGAFAAALGILDIHTLGAS